jgi:hypothetical protein
MKYIVTFLEKYSGKKLEILSFVQKYFIITPMYLILRLPLIARKTVI